MNESVATESPHASPAEVRSACCKGPVVPYRRYCPDGTLRSETIGCAKCKRPTRVVVL